MFDARAFKKAFQFRHAARFARDIDIIGTGIFQCEPYEFAPPLNPRPIIQFVRMAPFLRVVCGTKDKAAA